MKLGIYTQTSLKIFAITSFLFLPFGSLAQSNIPYDFDLIRAIEAISNGDASKGIGFMNSSVNNGNSTAMVYLGNFYLEGDYVSKDIEKGLDLIRGAGKKNNPVANNQLGLMFYTGTYVDKDINKAIAFFKKASEAGHFESNYRLGVVYFEGKDVEQDVSLAADYFRTGYENFASTYILNTAQRICKAKGDLAYDLNDPDLAAHCYVYANHKGLETYPQEWVEDSENYALENNGLELMYWLAEYHKENGNSAERRKLMNKLESEYRKKLVGTWSYASAESIDCEKGGMNYGLNEYEPDACEKRYQKVFYADGTGEYIMYSQTEEEFQNDIHNIDKTSCSEKHIWNFNWDLKDGNLVMTGEEDQLTPDEFIFRGDTFYLGTEGDCGLPNYFEEWTKN